MAAERVKRIVKIGQSGREGGRENPEGYWWGWTQRAKRGKTCVHPLQRKNRYRGRSQPCRTQLGSGLKTRRPRRAVLVGDQEDTEDRPPTTDRQNGSASKSRQFSSGSARSQDNRRLDHSDQQNPFLEHSETITYLTVGEVCVFCHLNRTTRWSRQVLGAVENSMLKISNPVAFTTIPDGDDSVQVNAGSAILNSPTPEEPPLTDPRSPCFALQ